MWRDLVSDPYFVNLHLSRSHEPALLIHKCKTSCVCKGSLEWVEIEHEADYNLHHVKSLDDLQLCESVSPYTVHQVGSVNGLICCFHLYSPIYIHNPVLDEYMILPKPRCLNFVVSLSYGFGVSGDYKVIFCSRKVTSLIPYRVYSPVKFQVHTLGTNRWRVLRQTPYPHDLIGGGRGVLVNSHVYWIIDDQIYDFDLDTEIFEFFPSPPVREDNQESDQMLGVMKGRLSWISWCSIGLEVWVMKEQSWYKEMDIQENFSPILWSYPKCLIDGLNGTSIFMVCGQPTEELVCYCLNTNKTVNLNCRGSFCRIMTFRPSFVKLGIFKTKVYHKKTRKIVHSGSYRLETK